MSRLVTHLDCKSMGSWFDSSHRLSTNDVLGRHARFMAMPAQNIICTSEYSLVV